MEICSIASGSSGNCIYIGTSETHLLVDAGMSGKKIEEGLEYFGKSAEDICGILITHEHSDHIKGIGAFVKKHKVPIYGTIETLTALKHQPCGKSIPADLFIFVKHKDNFNIGDITIDVTSTSHDSANSVCFRFSNDGEVVAMATDLGCYDEDVINHLSDVDILYLESNYDREMLMVGSYPHYLKLRIDGDKGHLSNDLSAELVGKVMTRRLKALILAHLSQDNNFPELAYQTHLNQLNENWNFDTPMPGLMVAKRDVPSIRFSTYKND